MAILGDENNLSFSLNYYVSMICIFTQVVFEGEYFLQRI